VDGLERNKEEIEGIILRKITAFILCIVFFFHHRFMPMTFQLISMLRRDWLYGPGLMTVILCLAQTDELNVTPTSLEAPQNIAVEV
jgi:hypothetical protein